MSRRFSNNASFQTDAEQLSTQDSLQSIPVPSRINDQQNYQHNVLNYECNQYLEDVYQKYLIKIKNNESAFQIFRPKGDLQLPIDSEEKSDIKTQNALKKYEIYSKLLKPLVGQSLYSIDTLKLKLKIDLLMLEQLEFNNFYKQN